MDEGSTAKLSISEKLVVITRRNNLFVKLRKNLDRIFVVGSSGHNSELIDIAKKVVVLISNENIDFTLESLNTNNTLKKGRSEPNSWKKKVL